MSFEIFTGCTNLTELTIPKTLKSGSTTPCLDNPNISKITLEDGLTIVPTNLCTNTGITEITIPNSVTEIKNSAFENCTKLNKITILDNVTDMGFYNSSDKENIFENANPNLTIFCYKDSMAAKYAIKYDINYSYLNKPTDDNQTNTTNPDNQTNTANPNNQTDNTTATDKLPNAGLNILILICLFITIISSIILYTRYYKNKNKD